MRRRDRRPAVKAAEYIGNSLAPEVMRGIQLAGLAEQWPGIAGPPGRMSRPLRMEQGELVVLAETPAVAHQLRMRGGDLCRKIRETWSLEVRSIRPIVGGQKRPSSSSRSMRGPEPKPPLAVEESEVQEAVDEIRGTIGNEDVLVSLARLMATYRKRFGVSGKQSRDPVKKNQRGSVHP